MIPLSKNPRLLVTRADRMGDLVLSTPVFSALRTHFPEAWIAALTFQENREILEGNPFLNEVILYDKKGAEKGWPGQVLFSRRLAAKKFDVVIHLHSTNRMHLAGWLAGIPARIGWDRKLPGTLTHAFPDRKKEGLKHEAAYNFELLEPLGVKEPAKLELFYPVMERARRSLENLLFHLDIPTGRPWIAVSPGASCPSKRWPAERFGYAAGVLARKHGAIVLGIGTAQERPLLARVNETLNADFYDLSGRLSLGTLGALFQKTQLLISNDSGPVHVAAAVGTPVISIFGRNQPGLSPRRWAPLSARSRVLWRDIGCNPCLAHACRIHFLCLDAVREDDVIRAADELWEKKT